MATGSRITTGSAGARTIADRRIPAFVANNLLRRVFFSPKKFVSKYISRGQAVADIGCGPGYFTIAMAEIVGREGKVFAADFDNRSIEALIRKAEKHGYSRIIEARATSAANLRFIPDSSVDFVFANGLLCCMVDHEGAIREIDRILKKEKPIQGRAYLSVTKRFLRKEDPRTVGKEEWSKLLYGRFFNVLNHDEGFLSRWAVLGVKDAEHFQLSEETEKAAAPNANSSSSSCCCCTL